MDRQVPALVAGDFNGMVVRTWLTSDTQLPGGPVPAQGGEWSEKVEFRIPDINPIRGSLVTGDLEATVVPTRWSGQVETFIYYQSRTASWAHRGCL
ncbi:MAG: hypothetical protein Ct9H300mP1_39410 [Planctomycetaceae bacterium]|nr:MAG: hypothetical protein Ct9H300mP1_39410 [Planctomycetaceae bacterium]